MNDEKASDINTVLIYVRLMHDCHSRGPGPSLNIGGPTGPPGPLSYSTARQIT